MNTQRIKTFILEENHEAFIIWNNEIWKESLNPKDNILLHIDEHIDMVPPRVKTSIYDVNNFETLVRFTYEELSINSFIIPAIFKGVFSRIFWINRNSKHSSTIKRCVRTYNNEGKKFILFNPVKIPSNGNVDMKKYIVMPTNINDLKLTNHKNIVLDISLNYFSCVSDPNEYKVNYIEITKNEFDEFVENYKYHSLKFELIGHRITAREEQGKYYYVINDHDEIYSKVSALTKDEIIRRIDSFVSSLVKNNIIPSLITLTRSSKSGYTPEDWVDIIENELLDRLKRIYNLEISFIEKYLKKNLNQKTIEC
ncbi:MAG: hypothetical protein HOO91_11250 [Bacteroidales bacterium]|nr:hypothetical protein [Bacteroidales bacterium]